MAYVALNIPDNKLYYDIIEHIDPHDLYDNNIKIHINFHITLFYNFPDSYKSELIKFIKSKIKTPITIKINHIDYFHVINTEKKYDVLYLSVISPELENLYYEIKNKFKVKTQHKIFVPHITICKLKYGLGEEYSKKFNVKYMFKSNQFIFLPNRKLDKKIEKGSMNKVEYNELIDNAKKLLSEFNLIQYVVPQNMTLNEWLDYRKKHKITAKEYAKQHPKSKWKVVHSNPRQRGQTVKGMSNMSYEKARKAHEAIMISKIKRGKAYILDIF